MTEKMAQSKRKDDNLVLDCPLKWAFVFIEVYNGFVVVRKLQGLFAGVKKVYTQDGRQAVSSVDMS